MKSVYQLDNVRQCYHGRTVLSVDHLELPNAEILALVGPTGAGKSTLLRLLAGLEAPAAGQVFYHHRPLVTAPLASRREITLVFQRPQLLTGSVAWNAEFGLRFHRLPVNRETTLKLLHELGLNDMASRPASHLSGGEVQLVAMARALILDTKVLLLDEPTAHLDPARVLRVERVIQNAQRRGATIVLATHNLFQARRLADRIALILDGQLIEVSPTSQFFAAPNNPKTAAFTRGEMVY